MSSPTAPAAAPSSAPSTPSTPSAVTGANSPSAPAAPSNPQGLPPGDRPSAKGPPGDAPGDAAADKAEAAAIKEEIRKFKLKVNGREQEVDEATLIRKAQMAEAADERFKEAAAMRKQFDGFLEQLRSDPMSVLTHPELGIDFRGLSEQYLTDELKKELMPPEQRELEELRQYRKQAEEREAQTKQDTATQAQQREMQELQMRAAREYDIQITEALNKSDLPKNPYTVKRVVEVMQNALTNGYDLDVATAVDMVSEGYTGDVQSLVGGLDGEALIKRLGENIVKKIRQHDLAGIRKKLEGQQPAPAASQPNAPRQPRDAEPKKLNMQQWLEQARLKAGV